MGSLLKRPVETDKAPGAVGPYSQGIACGGFLYVSGQLGLKTDGNFAGDDVESQARQAMENIKAILEAAGMGLDDVVKCTIYLTSMDDFPTVNKVYGSFFKEPYPARACVEVSRLPKGGKVEIEAVATKG